MRNYKISYFILLVLLLPCIVGAQLQLAPIFSDNMILQRNQPIVIYGKSIPGNTVSVSFKQIQEKAVTQADSSWKIIFPKQTASSVPFQVSIHSSSETIQLHNLLIGDVWVCIGQSNMEWPMMKEMHFKEEKATSNQPLIRLFNPVYAGKNIFNAPFSDSVIQRLTPDNFFSGKWQTCDSNTIRTLTAVGYYFASAITRELDVPVGIIHYSMGGAPLESFISKEAMRANPAFAAKVSGNWLLNTALPDW
ncbi:MAG: sialate O-acetylesterase, partial [Sediminibacterium sp.]|nr:sialate O-acetylesterase [Sediminibacterium sp.]